MKKLILKLLPIVGVAALLMGAVVFPVVERSITSTQKKVYQLTANPPDVVSANKDLWDFDPPKKDDPEYDRKLMKIYGLPNAEPDVLVLIDASKIIYPAGKERPELALFPVDKKKGENPWQLKTIKLGFRVAKLSALGLGLLLTCSVVLFRVARPAPPGRSPAADTH